MTAMDVERVREIARQMRELGLPESTVKRIEREADEAEERQAATTRPTEQEVRAAVAKVLDANSDGVVDFDPQSAAYWSMATLHDLGLIRTGAIRQAWEPT